MKKPSFLHVVVGSGIPIYFLNSIKSVLQLTGDNVFAVYNSVNSKDRPDLSELQSSYPKRLDVRYASNSRANRRTGGMHHAYNCAIDFARESYDYINFIQADQQLMLWPRDIEHKIHRVFENYEETGNPIANLVLSFPAQGYSPSFYDRCVFDRKNETWLVQGRGSSDTGVYRLDAIRKMNFRFQYQELVQSAMFTEQGYALAAVASPLVSFLPWPATVRSNRVGGKFPRDGELPLQKLRSGYEAHISTPSNSGKHVWAEDWIIPGQSIFFFPYHLSDFRNSARWVPIRRKVCNEREIGFWTWIGPAGDLRDSVNSSNELNVFPGKSGEILHNIIYGYLRRYLSTVKRLLVPRDSVLGPMT